jgi:hypothetical protein
MGGKIGRIDELYLKENMFSGHFIYHKPDKVIICGGFDSSYLGRFLIEKGFMDDIFIEFYGRGGPAWSNGTLGFESEKLPEASLWKGLFIGDGNIRCPGEVIVNPIRDGVQLNLDNYKKEISDSFKREVDNFKLRHL